MGRAGRTTIRAVGIALALLLVLPAVGGEAGAAPAADPLLRVGVEVDRRTFLHGEDVTGVVTFTNPTGHDVLVADDHACLEKWGVLVVPVHVPASFVTTLECRSAAAIPVPRDAYLAFPPGITRVPFALASARTSCTHDPASVRRDTPRCVDGGYPPALPNGRTRVVVKAGDHEGRVRTPAPVFIHIDPVGHHLPFCAPSQLRATAAPPEVGRTRTTATFTVSNTGRKPCRLDGVPGINLEGPSGYDQSPLDPQLRAAHPVRLAPRHSASFTIRYATRPCDRPIAVAHVHLPDQAAAGAALDVATTANPCSVPNEVDAVTISPFVSGRPHAGARRSG